MFGAALCTARSFFRNHFAYGRGCRCTGTPKPSDREEEIGLVYDFVRWLEGHFQTRFQLRDFIGKRLELTRFFVMHVRHEDAEFVVRQSAKHLLDFWKMDCLLSGFQHWIVGLFQTRMRTISPHPAYAGRTSPVRGRPHLLMLSIASMAKARLAFFARPR